MLNRLRAIEYIPAEIHPNLAKDSVGLGGRSKETINRKWDELAICLNTNGSGATKNGQCWRRGNTLLLWFLPQRKQPGERPDDVNGCSCGSAMFELLPPLLRVPPWLRCAAGTRTVKYKIPPQRCNVIISDITKQVFFMTLPLEFGPTATMEIRLLANRQITFSLILTAVTNPGRAGSSPVIRGRRAYAHRKLVTGADLAALIGTGARRQPAQAVSILCVETAPISAERR
ncbi:unnamed protein product [Acanthoscelides obtectus]|uniref:Uncharacterized protein n=1 Tax=Acanthoscelides obtectus TaxID=200917 RepID=A0A9P0L874_ACAOB|nr:unnamed protein product [Acanthoscelides obtectus]CAK1624537.1 hypothetical protein AOBTE_LOCUS2595 [Acanthoscelides obtectus]